VTLSVKSRKMRAEVTVSAFSKTLITPPSSTTKILFVASFADVSPTGEVNVSKGKARSNLTAG